MIFKFTSVKSLPISQVAVWVRQQYLFHFTTTAGFPTPSMSNSKKRSSPGADTTKSGDPFTDVDIGDAEESILTEYQKKIQRVELILGKPVPLSP